jgi:23S rRNA pseudouridine2457 synthase
MAHQYLLFYKPYNVLTELTDAEGRPALADYVPVLGVYAAGRLDRDSEGLVFLTDDGRLAHLLTHPRHKLPKTYLVQVEGVPGQDAVNALRTGVLVKGEHTAPAEIEMLSQEPMVDPRPIQDLRRADMPTAWLRIILREGRKRQIRHMTAAVGHPTLRLIRVAIGPLGLGSLQPGQWRRLTGDDLAVLRKALLSAAHTSAGAEYRGHLASHEKR